MSRKYIFITIPLSVLLISGLFVFYRHSRVPSEIPVIPTTEADVLSPANRGWSVQRGPRTHLHPLASEAKLAEAKQQPVETWEEWLDATVEILLAEAILYGEIKTPYLTMSWVEDSSEEVAASRAWLRESLTRYRERLQSRLKPPPEYPGGLQSTVHLDDYQGPYPQTPASLIAEFDAVDKNSKAANLDEHYPKEAWLKTLLEKGASFNNYNDYRFYLKMRQSLLQQKEKPEEWISGQHGIPITTNFEEYSDGFIERKIWEYNTVQKVREENPGKSSTVFFDSNDPDKYFPRVGKMTYVNIGEGRERMSTFGTLLTEEQRKDIFENNIEPKNIEIVYLDDENNVIYESPPLVDERQRDLENVISFDGIKVTPENYERLIGRSAPEKWLEFYEIEQASKTQDTAPAPELEVMREAAREAAAAAQEAAKAEFEKFQNNMRNLAEFATMSDAEIEKALERQFRRQFLPEHPAEQFTPERLEEALGTLFQHGFEEGFRRVRRDSPALAEQLERHFGQGQKPPPAMQKKPQRPAPPKPPETAPPETEAP